MNRMKFMISALHLAITSYSSLPVSQGSMRQKYFHLGSTGTWRPWYGQTETAIGAPAAARTGWKNDLKLNPHHGAVTEDEGAQWRAVSKWLSFAYQRQ